jgi:hypothetical protein
MRWTADTACRPSLEEVIEDSSVRRERYPIHRDVGTGDVDADSTPTAELNAGPEPSIDAEA